MNAISHNTSLMDALVSVSGCHCEENENDQKCRRLEIDASEIFTQTLLEYKNPEPLLPSDEIIKEVTLKTNTHDEVIVELSKRCIQVRLSLCTSILQLFYDQYCSELAKEWRLRDKKATTCKVLEVECDITQLFFNVLDEIILLSISIDANLHEKKLFPFFKYYTRYWLGQKPIELREEIDKFQKSDEALEYLLKLSEKTANIKTLRQKSKDRGYLLRNENLTHDVVTLIDLIARHAILSFIGTIKTCSPQFYITGNFFERMPYYGIKPLIKRHFPIIPFYLCNAKEKMVDNCNNIEQQPKQIDVDVYDILSKQEPVETWDFFKPLFEKRVIKQLSFHGQSMDLAITYLNRKKTDGS